MIMSNKSIYQQNLVPQVRAQRPQLYNNYNITRVELKLFYVFVIFSSKELNRLARVLAVVESYIPTAFRAAS